MNEIINKRLAEFDKKFGSSVHHVEQNEPSSHGKAGCDDCYESQKERAEHRAFLESSIKEAYEAGRSDENDRWIDELGV